MTSSMLTGERRWGAPRRGGMTVLGKVAVPKPINLPSQRLENHGLDPTVEIVPKGTLSWGNRSSASNAWGSSTISPSTDGGSGSPSHLSGRPSSGGSGTRPSTAGSDRASESTASAWGPSSRPSSASGPLTSNQSSLASLRPRSAETRPGSSQLSRFAEPLSENPVAWGAAGTAEKLGVASSKSDGFSLTSGDFPTLGSEKDNFGKNTELQEHGSHARPGSSSGKVAPVKERTGTSPVGDVSVNDVKSGAVNTWKRDNSTYVEDGPRPSVEKWRGESQPYLNASIPPQHFEPWHGTPSPGGVWFRGPPGPPYGAPVTPGGFPMEPFPYYRPQIPATALANSQPVPPPGAGPRGHHPKNGDMYRPHMPDAYIRPGMPIRPGFYPGPVPYEGYYPPPMGYCNSNERDLPFMGMAAGPPVYERYSNQNARDSNNSHARTGGYGSSGKAMVPEQAESGYHHDNRGPYKVLLKQHNDWDGKDEQKWDHTGTTNASDLAKGDQRKTLPWDDDWEGDPKKVEELDSRRIKVVGEAASQTFDNQMGSSAPVKVKLTECVSSAKPIDDSSTKKFETAASTFPEAPKPSPPAPKDSTLIQKIEGLNAKARASDGRHDAPFVSSREKQKNGLQVDNTKTNQSTKEADSGATYSERIHTNAIPASHEVGVSTGLGSKDRSLEQVAASGTVISRRATHGGQGRVDHRGKGRVNAQDVDGWRKKSLVADSSSVTGSGNVELSSNVDVQDCHSSMQVPQKSGLHLQGTEDGESGSMSDPSDSQAQRAKMKEIAKQRGRQLQKEEEERLREQKAKAHAKLEELNRRTRTVDGSTQKLENVQSSGAFQHKQEELQIVAESNMDASKIGASSSALVSGPSVTTQIHESNASRVGGSTDLSRELPIETPRSPYQEPIISNNQSLPLQQNANSIDAADNRNSPQINDASISKQKRVGYKQRQNIPKHNIPVEKNLTEKLVSTVTIEVPKSLTDVVVSTAASVEHVATEIVTSSESNLPVNANVTTESGHQRRKNNRIGRNKLKLEEASLPRETNPGKASVENAEPKASVLELDPSSIESISNSKDAIQSFENRGSLPNEEAHGRPTNQWKPQHPRRMPRNPQVNRSVEKFHNSDSVVWAPVQSQNKSEVADEVSQKTVVENTSSRGDHQVQNNLKNKRAEIQRYVPKPVAKELAQQGSIQRPTSPSINQTTSDETIGRGESGSQSTDSAQLAGTAIEKSGFAVESRNGDTKPNRQAKSGSWRQRVPIESTHVQGLQEESSYNSSVEKNVQKFIEHSETLKPDGQSAKGQSKYSDDWNTPDGWNTLESSDSAAPVPSAVVKDQGVTGRGKRHPFKGQKGTGNTHGLDHKNVSSGNTDKMCFQSSPLEMGQTDTTVALKENRGAGERSSSHWQPKSQAYPVHNQRGGRHNSSQNVNAEVARTIRKESTPHGGAHFPPQHDKETDHPHTDQPASETGTVIEAPNAGHQETKREEKNIASLKGRPHSPIQGPVNSVEPLPAGTDIRNEQRLSTGFRKNGNHSNRFSRGGHESHGDWSSGGQDNKQHNQPPNRERQRHNSHNEYQPVRPFSNNRSNFEGASDGSHNTSLRFRERGHGHSRRGGGNFYSRQSGNVQVDASYD